MIFYFIDEVIEVNDGENEIHEYDKSEDDNHLEKDEDNDRIEELLNQFGKLDDFNSEEMIMHVCDIFFLSQYFDDI